MSNMSKIGLDDYISRNKVLEGKVIHQSCDGVEIIDGYAVPVEYIESLPSVQLKTDVLDKIRAEIEQKAKPNEIGGRENGKSIRYGLCMALEIIDKYMTESEE